MKKKETKKNIFYENKNILLCILITAITTIAFFNLAPTSKDQPSLAEELGYDSCRTDTMIGILCKNETHVIHLGMIYDELYVKEITEVLEYEG